MLKRYLLFVSLSILVFWLYAVLVPPPRPPKTPSKETPQEEAKTPEPAEPAEAEEAESDEPPEVTEVKETVPLEKPEVTQEQRDQEQPAVLENAYCRMELTKYGAAVREIVLFTTETNKGVVIQGTEPVRMPRRAVEEELNPLVISAANGVGLDLSTQSFDLKESALRKAIYELGLQNGLKVTKTFELSDDDYLLSLEVAFENSSESIIPVGRHQVKVGTVFSLDPRARYRNISLSALGAEKARKLSANPKKSRSESFDFMRWASAGNKYFALILSPERRKAKYKVIPEVGDYSELKSVEKEELSKGDDKYFYSLGVAVEGFKLQPKEKVVRRYFFYAGPKEYARLKRLKRKFSEDPQFEKVMRFGWFGFVAVPLLKILKVFYSFIPNYGLAIIFLTILIKILLYPLDQKSYRSMKEMQKLQPLIAELKQKYKDDPRRAQTEQMKLFKEHKVNPMGGCLPMLLQMPVLIAMFQMIRSAVELRRAPFALWIKDLSEPDAIWDFGVDLPIIGHTLNVLPLVLVVTFILQSRVSKLGSKPGHQDPQQKMMGNMMTVIFGIIFYNMPSGLTLYFTVSTLLRLAQQYLVQTRANEESPNVRVRGERQQGAAG